MEEDAILVGANTPKVRLLLNSSQTAVGQHAELDLSKIRRLLTKILLDVTVSMTVAWANG